MFYQDEWHHWFFYFFFMFMSDQLSFFLLKILLRPCLCEIHNAPYMYVCMYCIYYSPVPLSQKKEDDLPPNITVPLMKPVFIVICVYRPSDKKELSFYLRFYPMPTITIRILGIIQHYITVRWFNFLWVSLKRHNRQVRKLFFQRKV